MMSQVAKHTDGRGDDHPAAIDGQEHEAEIVGAGQLLRDRVGHARGAEIVLKQPLDDEREAEGEKQAVERIEAGEPLEEQALDDRPDRADDQRREDEGEPIIEARVLKQEISGEGPHHVERAVGEIDDRQHAEDDREPEAQQRIERAVDEADQQLAVELRHADRVAENVHGRTHRSTGVITPPAPRAADPSCPPIPSWRTRR